MNWNEFVCLEISSNGGFKDKISDDSVLFITRIFNVVQFFMFKYYACYFFGIYEIFRSLGMIVNENEVRFWDSKVIFFLQNTFY